MKLWIKGDVNNVSKSCVVKVEITRRELDWLNIMGCLHKATHIYVDVGNDVHREVSVEVKD